MANIGKWNAPSAVTTVIPGATLNALGSGSMSASGSNVANQTNLDVYCDLEVLLDTFTPGASPFVAIYILEAIDGSNFPAQSAADLRLTTTQLFCTVPIGVAAGAAQRVAVRNLIMPPGLFQFKLDNQTGAALASTNNSTVRIITYNLNLNG